MGQVWKLVQQHMAETPYGVSARQIASSAGVKPSTFAAWKNLRRLPDPEHLRAVARQINVPYRVLLEAALTDTGYLGGGTDGAPITHAEGSSAEGTPTTPQKGRSASRGRRSGTGQPRLQRVAPLEDQ